MVNKADSFREKVRKRFAKIFTNSRIVRRVFGDKH
jgi:hypothetical protein